MVKSKLAEQGKDLFRLMNSPSSRSGEGVMAIVHEALNIHPDAATPLRNAALDEGIILKHMLLALKSVSTKGSDDGAVGAPRLAELSKPRHAKL
jgi:hypothetical protein